MANSLQQIGPSTAAGMIRLFRGMRVILDSDLAALYVVATKRLKEQLKRNRARFPDDFASELNWNAVRARMRLQSGSCLLRSTICSNHLPASRSGARLDFTSKRRRASTERAAQRAMEFTDA